MKVLLVDDDHDVREIIAFTIDSLLDCEIVEVESGNEAIKALEASTDYQLIVCDYNMPDGNGGVVYQYLLTKDLKIPYAFCSSDLARDHSEFNDRSKLLAEITKPQIFEGVQKMAEALEAYQKENKQQPTQSKEDDFCEATIDLVSNCPTFPCDIYIKVGEKTIKAFNKSAELTKEEVIKYKEKGIKSFLVKREDSRQFVEYISAKVIAILEDKDLTKQEKVLSAHDVIMETVRELGMSESVAKAAQTSVNFTLDYFEKDEETKKLSEFLFGSKDKNYLTAHSVGISYISVGILKQSAWDSPENRNKMVMAGLMHDMSVRLPEFTESRFSDEKDLINLKDHGAQTVTLLNHLKGVPEDVFKIIANHHERPDGSGVPRGMTGAQLSPLTSIFIYSHDAIDAVLELISRKEKVTQNGVEELLSNFDYGHGKFPKIIEAFKKANIFEEV